MDYEQYQKNWKQQQDIKKYLEENSSRDIFTIKELSEKFSLIQPPTRGEKIIIGRIMKWYGWYAHRYNNRKQIKEGVYYKKTKPVNYMEEWLKTHNIDGSLKEES